MKAAVQKAIILAAVVGATLAASVGAHAATGDIGNVAPPSVSVGSGNPKAAFDLSATSGDWTGDGAPLTYQYQWQDCDSSGTSCEDIAGATDAGYVPTVTDVGSSLRVVVTASDSTGASLSASSAVTGVTETATPDEILSHLAQDQTHSWVDDAIGFPAMMRLYAEGEHLYVTCGNAAEIGRELLYDAGYVGRVVQVITDGPFDYTNDGHLMLEVWLDGRWQLYDVDANVRAVDANGNGVALIDQVAAIQADTGQWQQIADDPLYNVNEPDPNLLALAEQVFSDPAAFYLHVMGVALLPGNSDGTDNGPMLYHDPAEAAHLEYYPGWRRLATDDEWATLTTTADPLPQPVLAPRIRPPAPQPTPPPPQPAPAPAPVAQPAPPPPALEPDAPQSLELWRLRRELLSHRGSTLRPRIGSRSQSGRHHHRRHPRA
jgi:hypothetical protein